jgi:hypothetical protein
MVVVVAAVGVASVAAIRQRDRNKQVMWSINADLHNLATAQEAYFADYATYTTDLSGAYRNYHGSTVRVLRADAISWEAIATHPGTRLACTSSTVRKNWSPPVCK